jgi:methylphosphotriester-DNA--protein-cysteine methyltransferase
MEREESMQNDVTTLVQYIKDNWAQGPSLKHFSAKFTADAGDIERAFRRATGLPVKKYIDLQRHQKLFELIKDTGRYGYEIGRDLGFKNEATFYRWVKRISGFSEGVHRTVLRRCTEGWHDGPGVYLQQN